MWSLREVLLTTFFCFLFLNIAKAQNSQGQPKIVIVGAGLSGFSAAAKLLENGLKDIVILEAEDRFGGRVQSVPYSNGSIDLGAQWVHGKKGNVIYELVQKHFKFGDTGFDDTDVIFLMSNGSRANQKQCLQLANLSDIIMEHSYTEMEMYNGSLGDFFTTKYQKGLQNSKFTSIPPELANQMLEFNHKETNSFFASPTWFDISARQTALSDSASGNQYVTWKTQGFKTVFDYITKKLPDPSKKLDVESKIVLKKEVINIKWNPNSSTEKLFIACADGSSYSADHIIFTASLGVLKNRHRILFTPNLPAEKITAIENIGFGTLDKIFLEFDKPFWPTDVNEWVGYSFLWSDADLKVVASNDREWLIDLNSFIRVDGFPNLLEGFMSGRRIPQFEKLNDTKLISDCVWLLEKFLGKSLPRPISMKRTRWMNNTNFLGSYSYASITADKFNVTAKTLGKTVMSSDVNSKPAILFAGEATHEKFSSYANGAVASGWRAGNELVNYITKGKI